MDERDLRALDAMTRAFGSCPRPQHFTNHEHCSECAEHDRSLQLVDVNTLSRDAVGQPGWDPMCFVSTEGFLYFLPALARICLEDRASEHGWYGGQFFSRLNANGPRNDRYLACTPAQRQAVVAFIEHLVGTRAKLIDEYSATDAAFSALEIWNGKEVPRYVSE